ncbi:MAG: hypothetical protein ACFFDK_19365 [Promethearchaeota archaeon]
MPECKLIKNCPFFHNKMENMPSIAELYKKKYCQGDNVNCARFKVFNALGRSEVPIDLFPNQIERVSKIINS